FIDRTVRSAEASSDPSRHMSRTVYSKGKGAMLIKTLQAELSHDQVSDRESDLFRHSQDESSQQRVEPEVVCFPESTEDVVTIVNIARAYRVPVTPYGAGSGFEGQAIPVKKGISVSFERMNRML